MIRTQIQLTEEQSRSLKKLASEKHVSVAELIRQSVDLFVRASRGPSIEERKHRAIAAVGRYHSECPDLSEEHDAYLAEAYGS
jgi:hypothetical protein